MEEEKTKQKAKSLANLTSRISGELKRLLDYRKGANRRIWWRSKLLLFQWRCSRHLSVGYSRLKELVSWIIKHPLRMAIYIVGLALLVGAIMFGSRLGKNEVFVLPFAHPSGIAAVDTGTGWICDWYNQTIFKYKIKRNKLEIIKTHRWEKIHPTGLALDKTYLWVCDNWQRRIFQFKRENIAVPVGIYDAPSPSITALASDGEYLWSCDSHRHKIYQHNNDPILSIKAAYDSPFTNPRGLFWAGETIWSCDGDSGRVYKHKMDAELSVECSETLLGLSPGVGPDDFLIGMSYDGKNIWLITEPRQRRGEGEKAKIYKYNILRLKFR